MQHSEVLGEEASNLQQLDGELQCAENLDIGLADIDVPAGNYVAEPPVTPNNNTLEESAIVVENGPSIISLHAAAADSPTQHTSTVETFQDHVGSQALEFTATPDVALTLLAHSRDTNSLSLYRSLHLMAPSKYSEHIEAYETSVVTNYLTQGRSIDANRCVIGCSLLHLYFHKRPFLTFELNVAWSGSSLASSQPLSPGQGWNHGSNTPTVASLWPS